MSCAATASRAAARASPRTPRFAQRGVARLRSCSARQPRITGNPNRPSSVRANRSACAVIACGVPSAWTGCPTTSVCGCHSATSASIASSACRLGLAADGSQRVRDAHERVADRDADLARPEIERKDRALFRVRCDTQASRVSDRARTAARNRCRGAASPQGVALRPVFRTARPRRASTVSHAFCAISCSSWPADQPA